MLEEEEEQEEEGCRPHSSGAAPLPPDRSDQVRYRQREMKNRNSINKSGGGKKKENQE